MVQKALNSQLRKQNFATLVLAEHFEGKLSSSVGSCLKAAQELNDDQVSFFNSINFNI